MLIRLYLPWVQHQGRCQGAGTVIYDASSANSTGMTYNLDAASLAAGNTVNALTGEVSFDATWNGTTTITAEAAGCNVPVSATHTVTIATPVNLPFLLWVPHQHNARVQQR